MPVVDTLGGAVKTANADKNNFLEIENIILQPHFNRVERGNIQNFVKYRQEVRSAFVNVPGTFQIFAVFYRPEYLSAENIGKSNDRVQWSSELMAHFRKKRIFCSVRFLYFCDQFVGKLVLLGHYFSGYIGLA